MNQTSDHEVFSQLKAAYRVIYEYELFTTPIFTYWNLSDLLSTIDNINPNTYKNSYTLERVFRESIPAKLRPKKPEKINQMFSENIHIIDRNGFFDAEMSPYACWALMKQIGDKAIFQQECFLHIGGTFNTIQDNANQTKRISLRATLAQYEKQLNGILGKFNQGPYRDPQNYSGLRRKINLILFDKNTTDTIRMQYKMSEKRTLSDYMGANLLQAYADMLQDIIDIWNHLVGMRTLGNLYDIAQLSATSARNNFKHGKPIQNFEHSTVNEVIKQRGQREYEFAKQFLFGNSH